MSCWKRQVIFTFYWWHTVSVIQYMQTFDLLIHCSSVLVSNSLYKFQHADCKVVSWCVLKFCLLNPYALNWSLADGNVSLLCADTAVSKHDYSSDSCRNKLSRASKCIFLLLWCICSGGAIYGLGLPKWHLAPTVKHTGQELGGELCEIFKFWSFLQSKSVNSKPLGV